MSSIWRYRKPSRLTRIASALAVLLTLELVTRFCHPDLTLRYIFDPDLGYQLRPNHVEIFSDGESELVYKLTSNSAGFRGTEWAIPKPKNVRRVAVLGDSYIIALAYPEPQTACFQLQARLNERETSDVRWEVMNFGVVGNNTPGELALYEKKVRQFEPDVVVLCTGIGTDIGENSPEYNTNPNAIYCAMNEREELVFTEPTRDESREMRYLSRFYIWQRHKTQLLIDSIRHSALWNQVADRKAQETRDGLGGAASLMRQPLDPRLARSWEEFPKLLREFGDRVERDGARFFVFNLPVAWQVHDELFATALTMEMAPEELDRYDLENRFAAMQDQLDFPLIDLTDQFREEAKRNPQPDLLYLKGNGHFTEHGNRFLADCIAEIIPPQNSHSRPEIRSLVLEPAIDRVRR